MPICSKACARLAGGSKQARLTDDVSMSDRTTRLFPLTRAAVNRTYLSKLEKGRELWGAGIIAELATVLELASWGLRCLPGTASDWERSAALYPINQPRFAAGQ